MDLHFLDIGGQQEQTAELATQNTRIISIRWFYIVLLTGVATGTSLLTGASPTVTKRYFVIGAVFLLFNTVLFMVNRLLRPYLWGLRILVVAQVLLDCGVATYVIYNQGGLLARTTILFAIPILSAGLLFSPLVVFLTAGLSSVGYLGAIIADTVIQRGEALKWADILVPAMFYTAVFFVLARIVTYLTRMKALKAREEAYDAFLALLTHKLRNPASAAAAIIDTLDEKIAASDRQTKRYLTMLKSENVHLQQLIDNLLETAMGISAGAVQDKIDLTKELPIWATRCAENHERRSDLHTSFPNQAVTVTANSQKLQMAFYNLLDNAFRYTERGAPVAVGLQQSDGWAEVTIEDRGTGIDKAQRQELFKKYALAKSTTQGVGGLGLGLFVANKIITAFGGKLQIASSKVGTRVIIKLRQA